MRWVLPVMNGRRGLSTSIMQKMLCNQVSNKRPTIVVGLYLIAPEP